MKRIVLIISTILIIISCNRNKESVTSFEVDIPNGNVKEICKYKANYLDNDGKTTEEFRIIFKTTYSNSKHILEQTHFDRNGKVNHHRRNTFNDEDLNTYSISEDMMINSKSIETKRYNSNGKIEKLSSTFDDSTNVIMLFYYDSLENIKKAIHILDNDTSIYTFEYTYNRQKKIILKKKFNITITT